MEPPAKARGDHERGGKQHARCKQGRKTNVRTPDWDGEDLGAAVIGRMPELSDNRAIGTETDGLLAMVGVA